MQTYITIGERFKDARTSHNQHGPQDLRDVEGATGISKSMISSLENDKPRDVGFRNVIKLAKHYGVSCDYLLGLSDAYSTNQNMKDTVRVTGLSQRVIERLNSPRPEGALTLADIISLFVELEDFFFDMMSCIDTAAICTIMSKEHDDNLDSGSTQLDYDPFAEMEPYLIEKGYFALPLSEVSNFYLNEAKGYLEQIIDEIFTTNLSRMTHRLNTGTSNAISEMEAPHAEEE